MHKLLVKLFIKDYKNVNDEKVRSSYGKLAGIVGIITNLILASTKMIVGLLSASGSMFADGVNNLSDSMSAIITFIGFKLSARDADESHPFGHQRIEYITGMIVSLIIILIGFTLGKDSVLGIIAFCKGNSDVIDVSNKVLVFGVLILSFLVKCWQAIFYYHMGKDINSETIKANSKDSINDCITTSAVLISTIIYIVTEGKVNIDSFAGLIVSIFIILTGVGLIKDTTSPLLGVVPSKEEVDEISKFIESYDGVLGIHDMVFHKYGPTRAFVTCHVEVSRDVDVMVSHDLIDNIERDVAKKLKVDLTIHMDPIEVHDEKTNEIKEQVRIILDDIDKELHFHDFRIVPGPTHTNVLFDIVVPINYKLKPYELKKIVFDRIKEINESYFAVIQIDQFYNRLNDDEDRDH